MTPSSVAAALEWANSVVGPDRRLGVLPKGVPCDPANSVLARATGLHIGPRLAIDPDTNEIIPLPDAVQRFVKDFDRGAFPDLKEN